MPDTSSQGCRTPSSPPPSTRRAGGTLDTSFAPATEGRHQSKRTPPHQPRTLSPDPLEANSADQLWRAGPGTER
eukprot:644431-Alexandrium_andersonii.AAC.1